MARSNTVTVQTLLDNSGLRGGVTEADGILSKFGSAAKVGVQGATIAAAAAFAKGFADAMDREAIGDKVAAQLGLGSAEQKAFMTAASDLYAEAWGESLSDVAEQMAESQRAFGDVDNLDDLTRSAYALAATFDVDVGSAIQDANELAESFGIDGAESFDLLAVAMQGTTADVRDELSSAIREYGGFFDGLGLSAEETLALLTDFGEDGAMALDKSADALKELTIRATDMSTGSVEAFEAAGLNAEGMAEMFLAGGEDARAALEITAASLLSIEDPTEQAAAAIALFGAPLEDLGVTQIPDFLGSLSNMSAGLGETSGAAAALGETVGGNLSTKFESFKRQALVGLATVMEEKVLPVVERAVAWFESNWPKIQATIEDVSEKVQKVVDKYWPQVEEIITEAVEAVQAVIERVTKIVQYIWERWGEEIAEFAEETWESIQKTIEGVLEVIEGVFQTFKALFEGDWEEMWEGIKKILSGAATVVVSAVERLWAQVKLAAKIAWDLIKTEVWNGIQALPGLFFQAHTLLWSAGYDLLVLAKNGIVAGIRLAADKITEWVMGIPGQLRDIGGDLFSAAKSAFGRLADGIGDALAAVPGIILDKVLGPLDDIIAKIGSILGLAGGDGLSFSDKTLGGITTGKTTEAYFGDPDQVAKFTGTTKVLYQHAGGVVGDPATPRWTGNRLRHDEFLTVLEAGETVIPRGGGSGGPLVGTLIVDPTRSIFEELETVAALHGVR